VNPKKAQIHRIVVFAPNKRFFGANILQIPFFQNLRSKFPDSEIVIWSPEDASSMMVKLNLANKLYVYQGSKSYPKMLFWLWKYRPDIVFNLRATSEGLNLLTGLSFAGLRVGFKTISPFGFLLNGKAVLNDETYMAYYYLNLLKPLNRGPYFSFEEIKVLGKGSSLIIDLDRSNICFMPGGGEGEHKKWGIQNFCGLAKLMQVAIPAAFFYFILGPQENDYIKIIEKELPEGTYSIIQNGSLADIVKISCSSDLTVANDCGPSHLAQMCEVNYIGVWGWMNQHPQSRIIKWTIARPNSLQVVAKEGEDIKTIRPEEVMRVSRGFISESGRD
jgi:ADP-heptose:LPS heptosyltransferase